MGTMHKNEQQSASVNEGTEYDHNHIWQMQDIAIVWLDSSTNNSHDSYDTTTQLEYVLPEINTFTDNDQCIEFIVDNFDTKVYLIISESVEQFIIPCIHDIPNIDSVVIFSDSKDQYEQRIKQWIKVKGVCSDITRICRQITRLYEFDDIPISFIPSGRKPDQLDPTFMYTQIMKEILLTIEFEHKHTQEFVDYCCHTSIGDKIDHKKVKQLEDEYHKDGAIRWYTIEPFLYRTLNRALQLMNGEVITLMGFFIKDLHRGIEQLHQTQYGNACADRSFTVYRGQVLTKKDFDEMVKLKGGLISFNNFLSTSRNRDVALMFTSTGGKSNDMVGVLFVMKVYPNDSSTSFASIKHLSQFEDEDEVLFSMHCICRIDGITPLKEDDTAFEAEMSLANKYDEELILLTKQIREETEPDAAGWERLSSVLTQIGQCDTAERICRVLLDKTLSQMNEACLQGLLGSIKCRQGQYEEAINLYEQSRKNLLKFFPACHRIVATSYNDIGLAYYGLGDYPKALSSYEQALRITLELCHFDHPDLAKSYTNIGNVHYTMGDHPNALSLYKRALKLQQQSLPSNHPNIASSCINIGCVYSDMGSYPKALSSYERAIQIQLQSLPSNHPQVASSYNNIGNLNLRMGNYPAALLAHKQALATFLQSLPSYHPDLASCYNSIGIVYSRMNDYSEALLAHQQALKIQQQSLSPIHLDVSISYSNISSAHFRAGAHSEALLAHEQALQLQLQSLPSNHPDIASSYINIGLAYYNLNDNTKALPLFEQALEIQKQSLAPDHPCVAATYTNIGLVYFDKYDRLMALSSYNQALKIQLKSLPSNHPDIAYTYNKIGDVYFRANDYSTAYRFYENALQIGEKVLPPSHSHLQLYQGNVQETKKRL
ncbi:unnamed protein product [Adineta ricciae]|uniref:ADP ribosyltransferase domain-containing protein n=1 Tax=Adineta ricciae TaxID=249248 RepID=A0A815LN99_ADIRI|nr:unnamed protein product [Adineta ricciae]CAF1409737.1 unnamed protein product [Adineta ricciae]